MRTLRVGPRRRVATAAPWWSESATDIGLCSRSIIARPGLATRRDCGLLDRAEGTVDGHARGAGCHYPDEHDQRRDRRITHNPDGKAAEQRRYLFFTRRPLEPIAEETRHQEQQHRGRPADDAAGETEQQEVALELPGDESVVGADEMQHLDDRAVRR